MGQNHRATSKHTLIVNLIKPLLAGRLPAAMADSAVRMLAIALGISGELGYAALTSSVTQHNLPALASTGFSNAVWSIIIYHLATLNLPEAALAGDKQSLEGTPAMPAA